MAKWLSIDVDTLEEFVPFVNNTGLVFLDEQKFYDVLFVLAAGAEFPLVYTCHDTGDKNKGAEYYREMFAPVRVVCATLEESAL